ncbi:MAG: transposase, partial [Actinobacteria bacterium]|nr:transposase [Actinomycetota bacterium]
MRPPGLACRWSVSWGSMTPAAASAGCAATRTPVGGCSWPISGRPGSSISAATPACSPQTPGRAGRDVVRWCSAQPQCWREAVQVVAIDLSGAYRSGIRTALPHARVAADPFHVVQLANKMVAQVRRRETASSCSPIASPITARIRAVSRRPGPICGTVSVKVSRSARRVVTPPTLLVPPQHQPGLAQQHIPRCGAHRLLRPQRG